MLPNLQLELCLLVSSQWKMLLSEEYNNGSTELEDETATWPFWAHRTPELVGKEAVYWLVIDLITKGKVNCRYTIGAWRIVSIAQETLWNTS